jgi:hypothetical protein
MMILVWSIFLQSPSVRPSVCMSCEKQTEPLSPFMILLLLLAGFLMSATELVLQEGSDTVLLNFSLSSQPTVRHILLLTYSPWLVLLLDIYLFDAPIPLHLSISPSRQSNVAITLRLDASVALQVYNHLHHYH